MVQDPLRAGILKEKLGLAENLEFMFFNPSPEGSPSPRSQRAILGMVKAVIKMIPLLRRKAYQAYRTGIDARIAAVARMTQATHCWFHFVQGQSVPKLSIPVCGLVHDQNFRFFPENLPKGKDIQFRDALVTWLREADMVSVLSEAGKQEIYGLDPSPVPRIEVIPNAVSPPGTSLMAKGDTLPHFLYPSAALAHKNHLLLFQAALLLEQYKCKCKFIICGKGTLDFSHGGGVVNPAIREAREFFLKHKDVLAQRVEFLGECSREKLERLYTTARAVVLPTKYEGFGLPLVEALTKNTPVLCSGLVPFREQTERYKAHDWVDFFDPCDPLSLAVLIRQKCAGHPGKTPGIFPVQNFFKWTWRDVANKYLELFWNLSP